MPGPPVNPTWDGSFKFFVTSGNVAASALNQTLQMDGSDLCNALILTQVNPMELQIYKNGDPNPIWLGTNGTASRPLGVYTRIDGQSLTPAELTITELPDQTTVVTEDYPCSAVIPNTLLIDLVQYYPLNEAAGNPRLDESGTFPLAEVVSPVGTMAGLAALGLAVVPSTVNKYLNISAAKSGTIFQNSSYSLSIWINRLVDVTGADFPTIVNGRKSTNITWGWTLGFDGGNDKLRWLIRQTAGTFVPASYVDIPNPNTWYHYVVTYDAATLELRQYRSGFLITSDLAFPASNGDGTSRALRIGDVSLAGAFFGAQSLGMWSRVLTAAEVFQLWNLGAGLQYPFA